MSKTNYQMPDVQFSELELENRLCNDSFSSSNEGFSEVDMPL